MLSKMLYPLSMIQIRKFISKIPLNIVLVKYNLNT